MGRMVAWIGVLVLALYLVFLGGGWLGIYATEIRTVSVALVALTLAGWVLVAWQRPAWRPRSALMPVIALALTSMALSTLTSRNPRQSVEYLGYAVLLAALYLLLVRLMAEPFFRTRLGAFATACAFVLGTAYVVLNVGHWITLWDLVGRITVPPLRSEDESLTYGNPSAVLTMVVLFACSAAAVIGTRGRLQRAALVVLALLALFTIVVSGSRAGWFAVGIAVLAMGALVALDARARSSVRAILGTIAGNRGARTMVLVLGLLAIVAAVVLAPSLVRRLTTQGADLRFNYLLAAARMFLEAPVLGVGPGVWVIEHLRYTYAPETLYFIPHAHNVYAQTAAELGLVGLLVGIALAASLVGLVRAAIKDVDPLRRRWGWAAAFALIYFGAHQLLDFYPNMAAVLAAAAWPVAWLDATTPRQPSVLGRDLPAGLGRAGSAVGLALVALACIGLVWTESPASAAAAASELANEGAWAAADAKAQQAVAADPDWAPYQFTMGLTAAHVGDHARAAAAFARVARSDDLPEAWLDLAAESLLLGDTPAARDALSRAARLGLQRPAIALAIGDLAERAGDEALADRAFTAAIAELPSLAGDPWWAATPDRAARYPRLVDAAIDAPEAQSPWEIALMAGDAERARALAPAETIEGSLRAEDVIDAWEGDELAFRRVLAATTAHPLGTEGVSWSARLEGRRGNAAAQNAYLRWAFEVGGGGGTEIRVSDHPLLGRTVQGVVAEFWGTYTYRRPTPWNPLVPTVVQLTLE